MAEKPTLILMPGLLCDAALWEHQKTHLSDLCDIKIASFTKGQSIAEFADAVLADAPKRFSLAGLSMGGYVAFEILRRCPERVERLALLDTSPHADTPEQSAFRREMMALVDDQGLDAVMDVFIKKLIATARLEDVDLVKRVRAMAARIGAEAYKRQQTALLARPDSVPGLGEISCPTVVIVGREDSLTPLAIAEKIAADIPTATLIEIEQCGHLATMEQPQALSAVLRYWLKS